MNILNVSMKATVGLAVTWMLVAITCSAMINPNLPACSLNGGYEESYLQEGDIMLGILVDIFGFLKNAQETFEERPKNTFLSFSSSSFQYYRHFLAAIFAIEEINQDQNILPNVTLGFHIHDSRANERKAISMNIRPDIHSSFYDVLRLSRKFEKTAGTGLQEAELTYRIGLFFNKVVSYGAIDASFGDRIRFPLFYRTVPSETAQYQVIIQLIKAFNWNWVGMISSDDETHQKASEEMQNEIKKNGICVAFLLRIGGKDVRNYHRALEKIRQSNASAILFYSSLDIVMEFLFDVTLKNSSVHVVWIMLSPLSSGSGRLYIDAINGSLVLLFHHENIPGLKDFLYKANPLGFPKDPFTAAVWLRLFDCYFEQASPKPSSNFYHICNANYTLKEYENFGYDVNNFRVTYSMYIAVYAVAHSLHAMYTGKANGTNTFYSDKVTDGLTPTELNQHLKKIRFRTNTGNEIFFNEKGEVLGNFDIMNYNVFQDVTGTATHVGTFISSQSPGLAIDKEAILWAPHFNGTGSQRIPTSNCSASCQPGYRKAFAEGKQICCYECVQCSEGEISPSPDMENCIRCPEDQWSNESRDKCIIRLVEFLSYKEPLGVALTTTALVLSFCSAAVFCLFLKHKKSPIVKANNQELSYILLLSLMLSFLCSLLFIGRPTKVTCLLRQAVFGIIFAICISSILGKTITVIIAFTATRPGSRLRNYVGTRVPKYILLLCTLPEVFICALWLIISPPFPDYDTHSATGKIILQCNEGSPSAFYIMVGYIALLAFVSFFVAYLARKLPDIFNEAQYITFSMLLFCSVWISFILAYVSTTGKYLAAVEIFAILVSSAGLLGLIFIPKCYIIFFKTPVSTRAHLI
eukprot:XP_017951926.1 PREDICTED: vomeronasal type-2 receptor 26-like [Xenopus tropicalis]